MILAEVSNDERQQFVWVVFIAKCAVAARSSTTFNQEVNQDFQYGRLVKAESVASPPQFNVGVLLPLPRLQQLIAQQGLREGSVASVIDSQLRVMARSRDPERAAGPDAALLPGGQPARARRPCPGLRGATNRGCHSAALDRRDVWQRLWVTAELKEHCTMIEVDLYIVGAPGDEITLAKGQLECGYSPNANRWPAAVQAGVGSSHDAIQPDSA